MSGNNPGKRWVMTVNKKPGEQGGNVFVLMSDFGHIYILYMYNTYICILINYKCGAHSKLINSPCFLVCHTYRYLYIFVLLLKASFDYIFLHLVSWYERNIF